MIGEKEDGKKTEINMIYEINTAINKKEVMFENYLLSKKVNENENNL